MKAIYLFNNQVDNEIICNKMCYVDSDNVIHVDRSAEEDTSDLPRNVFRVRSAR